MNNEYALAGLVGVSVLIYLMLNRSTDRRGDSASSTDRSELQQRVYPRSVLAQKDEDAIVQRRGAQTFACYRGNTPGVVPITTESLANLFSK
jgi:hypothetical protein